MLRLLLSLMLVAALHSPTFAAEPFARQGELDLAGRSRDWTVPVRLDGEWEFYWGRLLAPEDFHTPRPPEKTGYLTLPATWNDFRLNGARLGASGCATLRLRILAGPGRRELALRLFDVASAYRLWLNGRPLAASGRVGTGAATEVPAPSVCIARFPSTGEPLELVLQVSNYHYRDGGVASSILLGDASVIEAGQIRRWAMALFFIGSLMVMGVYHLVLYFFRRKNVAPLYFGCYCLLWTGTFLASNTADWSIRLFFPEIPAPFLIRVDLICFFLSVPVGYSFFRSLYPREFSVLGLRFSQIMAALFSAGVLLLPPLALSKLVPLYYAGTALLIPYSLAMLARAKLSRREGATFILVGFLILGLVGLNDMLYDLHLIRSLFLIPVGMFVFILFQAFALSLRFSRAFSAVERLSGELEGKNSSLEEEMAERIRLERKIVMISEEERRSISHNLHDGLCQQLTGARLRCSVLERKLAAAGEDTAELRQLSSLLEESVDHAYDLSRGLWPVEHDPRGMSPSLEELTRRFAESTGIAIEFRQERACVSCANEQVTHLYRIAQEAITNAVKHARPSRITVAFNCLNGGVITLAVSDNGIGRGQAARSKGGLGLGIMSHRAKMIGGSLHIGDAVGGGTVVTCTVPCETAAGEGAQDG
ncbi:sensor histidine kinase [Geobacter sp. FeAm09]|uniref:sensor histidine kinase n=1 Tax=Geobacter sp. FeAm09 TaxID=2597769 RepID=UPI0011F09807|nr:sensor histidine kinase [Geobacter sp. FeAm09]QEM69567.1 sensor histidine kinase [Geobacter sp. FeAm09]